MKSDSDRAPLSANDADLLANELADVLIAQLREFNEKYPHPETGELLLPLDDVAHASFADSIFSLLMRRIHPTDEELRWMAREYSS